MSSSEYSDQPALSRRLIRIFTRDVLDNTDAVAYADNEDSNQTVRMCRIILAFPKLRPVCYLFSCLILQTYEPAHDKTHNKTYVTSNDSDQPEHPPSMERVLVYPSF